MKMSDACVAINPKTKFITIKQDQGNKLISFKAEMVTSVFTGNDHAWDTVSIVTPYVTHVVTVNNVNEATSLQEEILEAVSSLV